MSVFYIEKKKSQDPGKVSRSKVQIAGHTHADGRPVKPQFAETILRILEFVILCMINGL